MERCTAFEELKAGHGLLRELPGVRVWGVDDGALVLGERLGMNALPMAGPGTIELHGVVTRAPASSWSWPDVDVWAWVDAPPDQRVQSVMKVTPGTLVLMPWQDAAANIKRPFAAGFDD